MAFGFPRKHSEYFPNDDARHKPAPFKRTYLYNSVAGLSGWSFPSGTDEFEFDLNWENLQPDPFSRDAYKYDVHPLLSSSEEHLHCEAPHVQRIYQGEWPPTQVIGIEGLTYIVFRSLIFDIGQLGVKTDSFAVRWWAT